MNATTDIVAMFIIAIVGVLVGFGAASFKYHDAQVMQAAQAYEECVEREYGMTPFQFNNLMGEMPSCG